MRLALAVNQTRHVGSVTCMTPLGHVGNESAACGGKRNVVMVSLFAKKRLEFFCVN